MAYTHIKLPVNLKKNVLALGPQVKNTVCFAKGDYALVSKAHSDLSSPKDFAEFEHDVGELLEKKPRIIAHDLHPEYASTKYAFSLPTNYYLLPTPCSLSPVQHHHAHIAACMSENGLKNQKVIGAAFDGTGLGSDGKLWGAEFLVCDYRNFQRAAHLKEVPLVGGEKAILEPWRLVEAWFDFKYSPRGRQLQEVYAAGINSPLASSMGRLFDAAAVLILGKEKAEFEGQLAVELEERAKGVMLKKNGSSVNKPENVISVSCSLSGSGVIDPFAVLLRIIKMLREGSSREEAAYYFHQAIAQMTAEVAVDLKKKSGINKVCLSGGVFQNKILLKLTGELLYNKGLSVYTHKKLSCNDSCISLGQAVIAGMRG